MLTGSASSSVVGVLGSRIIQGPWIHTLNTLLFTFEHLRCMLVLMPQSGNFVPNFAMLFQNSCQSFTAPNYTIPNFARSKSPPLLYGRGCCYRTTLHPAAAPQNSILLFIPCCCPRAQHCAGLLPISTAPFYCPRMGLPGVCSCTDDNSKYRFVRGTSLSGSAWFGWGEGKG